MKIYKNSSLTEEIVSELDLGIVDAGKSQIYEYYIMNELSNDLVDLTVTTVSNEVKILKYPTQLKARGSAPITLEWSPSMTIKKGLKTTLLFRASEIVKP